MRLFLSERVKCKTIKGDRNFWSNAFTYRSEYIGITQVQINVKNTVLTSLYLFDENSLKTFILVQCVRYYVLILRSKVYFYIKFTKDVL